ncbi:MAG: hypothetical protein HQK50_18045 [Oligoflexia bacterium]|nr:hypothetical protein [Oligoflexia bacterium]MBF0367481.1 hypothetical protein [Oligoflexia bacterium]
MKKIILLFAVLMTFSAFTAELPVTWMRSFKTSADCENGGTLWMLAGTPFAYLKLRSGEMIPMHLTQLLKCGDEGGNCYQSQIYRSIPKGDGLTALPTYEVLIPSKLMSSMPRMVVSYSGVQYECPMDYVDRE